MSANVETLAKIEGLEQLYRSGYRSEVVDLTIDKLIALEVAAAQREMESLRERLASFEREYKLATDEFFQRFQSGRMGDSADLFEWSAFYQMWQSARARLSLLGAEAA